MSTHRTVIAGGALAGVHCARALRQGGYDGTVELIDADPRPPYDRPPLSKGVLAGTVTAGQLALLGEDEADKLGLLVRRGVTALGLELAAKRLATSEGELGYDALVIATGCHAVRPAILGSGLDRVHVLRTLDDAEAIAASRDALWPGQAALVVGGGVIGMEVASSLRASGVPVVLVEAAGTVLQRVAGPAVGAHFARRARSAGVDLRTGTTVRALLGAGRVRAAELSDGTRVEAGLVVFGVGARPAVDWLDGSGVPLGDGVRCLPGGAVEGVPGLYAAGDVAHRRGYGRSEHWTGAADQGRQVAATLLADLRGDPADVPHCADYVWSDQFGGRLQVAGSMADGTAAVEAGSLEQDKFLLVNRRDGVPAGVAAVGFVREFLALRRDLVVSQEGRAA